MTLTCCFGSKASLYSGILNKNTALLTFESAVNCAPFWAAIEFARLMHANIFAILTTLINCVSANMVRQLQNLRLQSFILYTRVNQTVCVRC